MQYAFPRFGPRPQYREVLTPLGRAAPILITISRHVGYFGARHPLFPMFDNRGGGRR